MINGKIEKAALSNRDRNRYLKAMLFAGLSTAGIGAIARDIKSKRIAAKAKDLNVSKNAIIVPIKKTNFMKDLIPPDDLAKSRGEDPGHPSHAPKMLDDKTVQAQPESSADDINAKKKEILKNMPRSINFFKRASEEKKKDDNTAAENANGGDSKNDDQPIGHDTHDDNGDEARIVLRDQSGRFVSPTNPVAVAHVEKVADGFWKSILDSAVHPVDSLKRVANSAKDKPVAFTLGAVGSIYLAAKISDAINKMRKEKSERRLDDARERYVDVLQKSESEKTAQDIRDMAGAVMGASFVLPFAVTAIITNKIIENRNKEKNKEKELSNSFPDDPIILYKTSEDKEIEMSPQAMLSLIAVKRAMIESIERSERCSMDKTALFDRPLGFVSGLSNPMSTEDAGNFMMDIIGDKKNDEHFYNMVRAFDEGKDPDIKQLDGMGSGYDPKKFGQLKGTLANKWRRAEILKYVKSSKRMQDMIADRFTDPAHDKRWGGLVNNIYTRELNNYMSKYIRPGSWLHSLMSWMANIPFVKNYFIRKGIADRFNKNNTPNANAPKVK